uniref:Uncharacterized protein n=1 Tax=Cacopsylla melanoneura TaxID=428564 RepID=A0A8D8M797_9HEMI
MGELLVAALEAMEKRLMDNMNDLKTSMNEINNNLSQKIEELLKTEDENKKTISMLQKKVNYLEADNKRKNVLIFNLKEEENENHSALETLVDDFFKKQMKCEFTLADLDKAQRLGEKSEGKTRPVRVSLTTERKKFHILGNIKNLKSTGIGVDVDLPEEIVKKRKQLVPIMMKKRKEGHHAIMKWDQLYVDGIQHEEQISGKRKPSLSPGTGNTFQDRRKNNKWKKKK